MNNEWLIILLPVLVLGGFAYGVWQRQMARHDAEREFEKKQTLLQEDYRQLQVDHGVDLARADGLEQEVERLTEERDECDDRYHQMHEQRDEARKQRDELNRENAKLHTREKLLIDALNKQQEERGHVDEAPLAMDTQTSPKPRRSHKRQATDTASN